MTIVLLLWSNNEGGKKSVDFSRKVYISSAFIHVYIYIYFLYGAVQLQGLWGCSFGGSNLQSKYRILSEEQA